MKKPAGGVLAWSTLMAAVACGGSNSMSGGAGSAGVGGASGLGGSSGASSAERRDTLYVQGRHLYDRCGERVVPIGINHPTLYVDRAGVALSEIAQTGANVVRLFWYATHDVPISEAEPAIVAATENGLIPMLEMHDATGPGRWGNLEAIIEYWTSDEAVSLIQRHEQYLLVNVANEAGPERGADYDEYASVYTDAISRLRSAGIRVPLVIDASGWGRDYQVLLDEGPGLIQADPLRNLVLSAHLWDPLTRDEIAAALQAAVDADLPFLVGEFAHRSPADGCGPEVDYRGIMAEANARDIGWLAWSWGDNDEATWWNSDCSEFDMTRTFAYSTLERWGLEVAVTDENSIQNVAARPRSAVTGDCEWGGGAGGRSR